MPNEPLTRLPAESQSGHLRLESRREGHSPPPVPPPDVPLADESVPREDPDRPKLSRQKHAGLHGRLQSGSQPEGQVHQALLGDVLGQLGYAVTQNAVGVPDIVAKLSPVSSADHARERLERWSPTTATLSAARDALLRLQIEEFRRLLQELR